MRESFHPLAIPHPEPSVRFSRNISLGMLMGTDKRCLNLRGLGPHLPVFIIGDFIDKPVAESGTSSVFLEVDS
jgi:hypothetical protein